VTDDTERSDLAAMAVRLARGLMAVEQPILAAQEVSMWGYAVLSTLREEPVRAQSALARAIGADKTRLIPVLDELQRRGLIEREPDPADRRVHLLRLTPAGRDLQASVQAAIRAEEVRVLARLSAPDRTAFVRSLQILSEVVGRPDTG
jgi:MarR family transcriptional regulator, transcriptional regulator for hemolysin